MISSLFTYVLRRELLYCIVFLSNNIMASGLQVSPIMLNFEPSDNANGLKLSNTSNNVVQTQVRVYKWTQSNSEDQLYPTRELLASPPMVELQPGEEQLIRVIRTKPPLQGENAIEESYRILIDELPLKDTEKKSGLHFLLSYSLPAFVKPKEVSKTEPKLQWTSQIQQQLEQVQLTIKNTGNGYAQLASLSFIDREGKTIEIQKGLMGYILAGSSMNWTIKIPKSSLNKGGKFKVMLNGIETIHNVN